jgi:hypothetical protein
MTLDSRPSDAIALALRAGAPIFAAPRLIEEAGYSRTAGAAGHPAPAAAPAPVAPRAVASERSGPVRALRTRLLQAVAEEAYEEAARLRDEIARLEAGSAAPAADPTS